MTLRETRAYIAKHPWEPGHRGKGIVTFTGNVIHWRTHGSGHVWGDGHPWHREAVKALGYMPQDAFRAREYVRDMFTVGPNGIVSSYGDSSQTPSRLESE